MSGLILKTKLFSPIKRQDIVVRNRIFERLNGGFSSRLTLVSSPAGSGKTTAVGEWLSCANLPSAWLSLDEGDNDISTFLLYFTAALQTVSEKIGAGVMMSLQSPQPPRPEQVLSGLISEIGMVENEFVLVLDDYHVIDSREVDEAVSFILANLPSIMRLLIVTREDPPFPLAKMRAMGELTEIRASDLRFTVSEADDFLNRVMRLGLSEADVAALERRTEGWIAGLQLAAISVKGQNDAGDFIETFAGSHQFVMDYLIEEVLRRQPDDIQKFLLTTSILERMCGPLCESVIGGECRGQETLEYLEKNNLFVVRLDNERRWYRYHHLFAEFLRQRLGRDAYAFGDAVLLHERASLWFEANGLEVEAFQHAASAGNVPRALSLVGGKGMPLYLRGVVTPVLNWLKSLPKDVMDSNPFLWVMSASVLLVSGQVTGVEERLKSSERAIEKFPCDEKKRNIEGHIAAVRAMVAATQGNTEEIIEQSNAALEFIHPDNLPVRTAVKWKMGYAYELRGDRAAALDLYSEVVSEGLSSGNILFAIMAMLGLGNMQMHSNNLSAAELTFNEALRLLGELPLPPLFCEAHLGLARIYYHRNDLKSAEFHARKSTELAPHLQAIDRFIVYKLFLSRALLAKGDISRASSVIDEVKEFAQSRNYAHRMSEIADERIRILLRQGKIAPAEDLAVKHGLIVQEARISILKGKPLKALELLKPLQEQMSFSGWKEEKLEVMVLQSLALYSADKKDDAADVIREALFLAEQSGMLRVFLDEGPALLELMRESFQKKPKSDYVSILITAFEKENTAINKKNVMILQNLIEPLSDRELEILRLVAQGLSNDEICSSLSIALSTVKGHNRNIFGKLQVQRRTEAVARARELGLL